MATIAELTGHNARQTSRERVSKATIAGLALNPTQHALETITAKGFDADDVLSAFNRPTRVYPSGSHPGQIRVTGAGLCLVGRVIGNSFSLITVYLDQVLTAPRSDQMHTVEGRRFAQRHAAGLGRG